MLLKFILSISYSVFCNASSVIYCSGAGLNSAVALLGPWHYPLILELPFPFTLFSCSLILLRVERRGCLKFILAYSSKAVLSVFLPWVLSGMLICFFCYTILFHLSFPRLLHLLILIRRGMFSYGICPTVISAGPSSDVELKGEGQWGCLYQDCKS